jgi:SAM-dependent methyltransferase
MTLLGSRAKTYGLKQFLARERYRPDYDRLARFLLGRLEFDSVIDIGCGNGFLLEAFAEAGKEVKGIDRSAAVLRVMPSHLRARVAIEDFAATNSHWDLVCCVEVAEHVEPCRSEELVVTLARLARRWIYFSAAPPGQTGRGHINCRPLEHWLGWFAERGWQLDAAATAELRAALERLTDAVWLRQNSVVLRREGAFTPTRSSPAACS